MLPVPLFCIVSPLTEFIIFPPFIITSPVAFCNNGDAPLCSMFPPFIVIVPLPPLLIQGLENIDIKSPLFIVIVPVLAFFIVLAGFKLPPFIIILPVLALYIVKKSFVASETILPPFISIFPVPPLYNTVPFEEFDIPIILPFPLELSLITISPLLSITLSASAKYISFPFRSNSIFLPFATAIFPPKLSLSCIVIFAFVPSATTAFTAS